MVAREAFGKRKRKRKGGEASYNSPFSFHSLYSLIRDQQWGVGLIFDLKAEMESKAESANLI